MFDQSYVPAAVIAQTPGGPAAESQEGQVAKGRPNAALQKLDADVRWGRSAAI
jgi:hypothetical protein